MEGVWKGEQHTTTHPHLPNRTLHGGGEKGVNQ